MLLGALAPAVAAPGVRPSHSGGPSRAETSADRDPLRVTIDRVTPSVVPSHGDVTVAGTIHNRSSSTWSDLSVYLVTSAEPMTTAAQLSAAVDSDPDSFIGNRIVESGLYVDVPDLAPGAATSFLLSVPRGQLGISGAAGVYWLGVHVLGTSDEGRLNGADGRARTFLPLVPPSNPGTRLALGLQLRGHVIRAADGRLAHPDDWADLVAGSGRLRRLLELSSSSDYPLTWIVDPAVLEAVRSLAAGNPPHELGAAGRGDTGDQTGDETGDQTGGDTGSAVAPDPGTPEAHAANWLAAFRDGTAARPVLALPYGDLDVSAAVTQELPDLAPLAEALSETVLGETSVDSTPVVVPPNGHLAPEALQTLPPRVGVLLGDDALTDGGAGPVLGRLGGGRLLVAPSNHDVEGPQPGYVRSALAVRQRLLADAALHALSPDRDQPMVRLLPGSWNPGEGWRRAAFFRGLDVPWLTGTRITDVLDGPAPSRPRVDEHDLTYPDDVAQDELPAGTLQATASLIESGTTLSDLLGVDAGSGNPTGAAAEVSRGIEEQALEGSSVWSRFLPGRATVRTRAAQAQVAAWLGRISVTGPSFVVVSSETGTFQVTLVNGLDEPVTIGLRPTVVGGGLRVSAPDPVRLAAGGHGAMRIQVTAQGIGVHEVTLQPVTASGTALGEPETLSVRSSRVGAILWLVMAIGAVLLFSAIALRIWQRIRQRRRTHGPLLKRGAA